MLRNEEENKLIKALIDELEQWDFRITDDFLKKEGSKNQNHQKIAWKGKRENKEWKRWMQ